MTDVSRVSRPVVPAAPAAAAAPASAATVKTAKANVAAPVDGVLAPKARAVSDAGASAAEATVAQGEVWGEAKARAIQVPAHVAAAAKPYDLGEAQWKDEYGVSFERGYVSTDPKSGKITGISVPYEHSVKAGETLSKIGARYGMNYKDLAEMNSIKDPNKIQVGQKLWVGLQGQVVMPGDTLSKIAKDYGVQVADLVKWNAIKNPNLIKAGDVIGVPGFGC